MEPLAITGLGVVTPFAVGHEAFRDALRDPKEAAARAFSGPSDLLRHEAFPDAVVAEARTFDASKYLGDKGLRNFDRLTKFLIVAAKHALEDAGIKKDGAFIALDPHKVGILSSTAYGSLDAITELNLVAELEDPRYINPARFPNTVINAAAGYVGIWEDLRAPNVTIVDGNCGALDAALSASIHLGQRRASAFLVGGGDIVNEPLYRAFHKLGIVAERDQDWSPAGDHSTGMRMGEGAAYAVLERADAARNRNARVLGEITGYGTAYHAPGSEARLAHASVASIEKAIRHAIQDAGLLPEDIDAVACSASGIGRIDAAELRAIARALNDDVLIAAPKAVFGETFGASGALGLASALAWLEGAPIAPVITGAPPLGLEHIVVTAVGYYGNASAVVLRSAR